MLANILQLSWYEDFVAAWVPANHEWLWNRPLGKVLISALGKQDFQLLFMYICSCWSCGYHCFGLVHYLAFLSRGYAFKFSCIYWIFNCFLLIRCMGYCSLSSFKVSCTKGWSASYSTGCSWSCQLRGREIVTYDQSKVYSSPLVNGWSQYYVLVVLACYLWTIELSCCLSLVLM